MHFVLHVWKEICNIVYIQDCYGTPITPGEIVQVIDGALNFERTATDLYGSLWLYTSPYKEVEIFGQVVGIHRICQGYFQVTNMFSQNPMY